MQKNPIQSARYRGVFPVVPTTFNEAGELDLQSQKRCVDFMIDAGSNGLCIHANYSEQFSLSDAEREIINRTVLEHVAGRVPVIVTTSHYASAICAARSRSAQDMGAAMVMVLPPYHGATFRVPEAQIYEFFARVSDAIDIPIMIQDAPVSGTTLSPALTGTSGDWEPDRITSPALRPMPSRPRVLASHATAAQGWPCTALPKP